MITITLINKKGTKFEKTFNSPFLATKFYYKCKYSKELKIVGYSGFNPQS